MKIIDLRILLLLVLFATSCKKDPDVTPPPAGVSTSLNFAATLKGSNEVPANASTAEGFTNATFNTITKVLSMTTTFSGLNANNMHIHRGAAGVSGGVIFPFVGPYTSSPVTYTSPPLTAAQEDDLMKGLYYVNIHSATFPAGEIRGQLR